MPAAEIEKVRQQIKPNDSIADTRGVRNRGFEYFPQGNFLGEQISPAQLLSANMMRNMDHPEIQGFFNKVAAFGGRTMYGEEWVVDTSYEQLFNDPYNPITPLLQEVFEQQDEVLLKEWMGIVDNRVRASSVENITCIDRATEKGEVVRKEIVLIGGGPLTAVLAAILSPYHEVTIITDQNTIGKPWRNRMLYINSSGEIIDRFAEDLPLLDGSTTPLGPRQQFSLLDSNSLLHADVKEVVCDDGKTRKYIAGPVFGDGVASNIFLNATDYIVDQYVLPDKIESNDDGTKRLTLVNKEGKERKIDAEVVVFLTGPGKEVSKVTTDLSKDTYKAAARSLDAEIRNTRLALQEIDKILTNFKQLPPTDGGNQVIEQIKELVRTKTINIPPLLTQTSLEKIYDYWLNDLDADPARFPLLQLLQEDVGVIGNGDTARTIIELLKQRGPKRAYPILDALEKKLQLTVYNESRKGKEYDDANRRRYEGAIEDADTVIPAKVKEYFFVTDFEENISGVAVRYRLNGKDQTTIHRYIFDATGYGDEKIESEVGNQIYIELLPDQEGNIVGVGNFDEDVYIAGVAGLVERARYPKEIDRIFDAISIGENSVALWLYKILAERLGWTILNKLPVNKQKIEKLGEYIPEAA